MPMNRRYLFSRLLGALALACGIKSAPVPWDGTAFRGESLVLDERQIAMLHEAMQEALERHLNRIDLRNGTAGRVTFHTPNA